MNDTRKCECGHYEVSICHSDNDELAMASNCCCGGFHPSGDTGASDSPKCTAVCPKCGQVCGLAIKHGEWHQCLTNSCPAEWKVAKSDSPTTAREWRESAWLKTNDGVKLGTTCDGRKYYREDLVDEWLDSYASTLRGQLEAANAEVRRLTEISRLQHEMAKLVARDDAFIVAWNKANDRLIKAKNEAESRISAMREALKKLLDKVDCIRHWHDTSFNKATGECEGMIVSAEAVRNLWAEKEEARKALEI